MRDFWKSKMEPFVLCSRVLSRALACSRRALGVLVSDYLRGSLHVSDSLGNHQRYDKTCQKDFS